MNMMLSAFLAGVEFSARCAGFVLGALSIMAAAFVLLAVVSGVLKGISAMLRILGR